MGKRVVTTHPPMLKELGERGEKMKRYVEQMKNNSITRMEEIVDNQFWLAEQRIDKLVGGELFFLLAKYDHISLVERVIHRRVYDGVDWETAIREELRLLRPIAYNAYDYGLNVIRIEGEQALIENIGEFTVCDIDFTEETPRIVYNNEGYPIDEFMRYDY